MSADQLAHLIRHVAAGQGEVQPFRYGYIATYDPSQHRVRCIIPSMTDQDGTPTLSPWMPVGTPYAGGGGGVQIIYGGGATADNPTGGEQCLIAIFDPRRGVAAVPCMFFHTSNPPPGNNLPTEQNGWPESATPNQAGDMIFAAAPRTDGGANAMVRMRRSGDIEFWTAGQMTTTVIGNSTITVNGTATIAAAAINLCHTVGDTLQSLCMDAFRTLFNSHTHGNGPVPTQQAGPDTVTAIVKAE